MFNRYTSRTIMVAAGIIVVLAYEAWKLLP